MTTDRDAVERLAPERIWLTMEDHGASWSGSFRAFRASDLDHGDEYPEYVLKSHADAQLQAAVAEMREAACELARAGFHPREIRAIPAPTDALDRLIAEQVWEARMAAFEDAADMCKAQAKPFARDFVLRCLAKQGYSLTSRVKQRMLVRLSRELRARARSDAQNKGDGHDVA